MMEGSKTKHHRLFQGSYLLDNDIKKLQSYLVTQGWLAAQDNIETEVPGKGNMNMTLRVKPGQAPPFIIKQARPWVEKFPELAAPVERIQVEHQYYQYINSNPLLTAFTPAIIGFDKENSLLAIEDLGSKGDLTFLYGESTISEAQLVLAVTYLNHLSSMPLPSHYMDNIELRKLNHQHIFDLPFHANDFKLDQIQPGLDLLSRHIISDPLLVKQVKQLGAIYLGTGNYLLHGDFYPGSMLQSNEGLKIIDPEFSFIGPAEWDIGVFMAHLYLTNTPERLIRTAIELYKKPEGFDSNRLAGFVGVEIIRRLIGLAQLGVNMTIGQKSELMNRAANWIKTGKIDTLSSHEKYTFSI